jgi:hypothetical protein
MRGLVFHRCQQPALLDHTRNPWRQSRCPGIAGLECLDGPGQISNQVGVVDFKVFENFQYVRIGHFEQFNKKVLDIHLIMRLGKAESGCRFQSAAAGFV